MKNHEFFNLMPEEIEILKLRFTRPGKSISEVGELTGWGKEVVRRNESLAMVKIRTAFKNCGITMEEVNIKFGLSEGVFQLNGIVENKLVVKGE